MIHHLYQAIVNKEYIQQSDMFAYDKKAICRLSSNHKQSYFVICYMLFILVLVVFLIIVLH